MLLVFLLIALTTSLSSNAGLDIFFDVQKNHASPSKSSSGSITKKEETCIITRDGICLHTNVYYPDQSKFFPPYSSVYQNTPYGEESIIEDASEWNNLGFVYLAQDVRGRFRSNGTYVFFTVVGNDSLDSIEWIISQSWSDGNVATYGISANALGQYGDVCGITQYLLSDNNTNNTNYKKYDALFQHILIMQPSLGIPISCTLLCPETS